MSRRDEVVTLAEGAQQVETEFLEIQRGARPKWLSTGFRKLDEVIGGLQPTLIIIGAQPGIGKSAFLAGMIRALGKARVQIGVFSLEDRLSWLVWRLLAYETSLDQQVLRSTHLSHEARVAAQQGFEEIRRYGDKVFLDDRPALSPRDICEAATRMIQEKQVRAILVDHLGEMRFGNARRERYDLDVGEGLGSLRALANEHQIPVVCATQLRRDSADREHPLLTDFANSAEVERKARIALALTRKPDDKELTVWVLKNTNGRSHLFCRVPFDASAALVIEKQHGLRSIADAE